MSNEPSNFHQSDPSRSALLQKVLEQALLAAETDPSSPALVDEVRSVAARHAEGELSFDPGAVDVVQVMLCRRLGVRLDRGPGEGTPLRRLATEVASTLWDHPDARKRLERLWSEAKGS